MPLRAAAICGLLAPVTFVVGLLLGDLAQPGAFSPADNNISDIGAQTADQAWLYNQIAANLNGLLIVAFALGLWRALGSGWLARLGVLGLAVLGVTRFFEGFLRLDCRGMDDGCENTSWQADGHGIESGIASALFFLVPLAARVRVPAAPTVARPVASDAPRRARRRRRERPRSA